MRILLMLAVLACASAAKAGLEPRDEALLAALAAGEVQLPGAVPVGYEHKFEVGDLQEVEVLDRGVYRTLRYHIVLKLDSQVLCEVHNGRGLVFAGLMDDNGVFSRAWVGRSGEKPVEVKFRRNLHMQTLLHEAVRVPWPMALYNQPATGFREGASFALGGRELTVQAASYKLSGVRYDLLMSHGSESWFGPYWQWSAEGVVLQKVTRREKLAAAAPLLVWSGLDARAPAPIEPPAWTAPKDEWTVQSRADGSIFVLSFEAAGEFQYLDAKLNTVSGAPRIGPYGKRDVDACSPGPILVPASQTLQLQAPGGSDWACLDFLLQQAARLPVAMLVLTGPAAGDRGLKWLKDYSRLEALDLFFLGATVTAQGFRSVAGCPKLWDLALTFVKAEGVESVSALKDVKSIRRLALRAPDLAQIPAALSGWTGLESLEFTGKDIAGVKSLTGLTHLALVHSEVSRKSADEIATLPALRKLELHNTSFAPSILKKLSLLEQLGLTFDTPEEAAPLIEAAATLKALRALQLEVRDLAAQDIAPLAGSQVESLSVNGGLAQPRDVVALAKLTKLASLTLTGVKGADASALSALSVLTGLKSFTLASPVLARSKTASVELAALSRLTFLEELHLLDCGMARAGPLRLGEFRNLKALSLEKLNIEPALISELAACPKLATLALNGSLLPKGGAETLATLKGLRRLDLRANHSILKEDLERLRAALPDCEILR